MMAGAELANVLNSKSMATVTFESSFRKPESIRIHQARLCGLDTANPPTTASTPYCTPMDTESATHTSHPSRMPSTRSNQANLENVTGASNAFHTPFHAFSHLAVTLTNRRAASDSIGSAAVGQSWSAGRRSTRLATAI